jgi:type IV pilus assembly protein PilF
MTIVRSCVSLAAAVALAALVAGCESTSSSKQAAPAPPPQLPKPPPMQEAPPAYRAQLHAEIAAGFYERGQMQVAMQELDEAMKLDPTNAKIYNVYGLVYAVLGEDANAQRNFQQAVSLAPNDSEIRQNWGWFLCTHGRPRESIPEFEMAIKNPLYKSPDVALTNAGKCSIEFGDNRAGETYLKRALAINPGNISTAYNLALLMYRESRIEEARTLMRRVMAAPNPAPDALYLGMCIERKASDRVTEASYVQQLKSRYPESAEAKAIPPGVCQ